MSRPFLVFGAPFIEEAEIAEVVDTLRSGWIGTGPKVARFEDLFRRYIGAEHAIAVSSCTAALHLCLVAAGVGPGSEVITTAMTFVATANAVVHAGAVPILTDCDRRTGLMDPERVEAAITPRTRAIIPVHLHGRPCAADAIMEIAARHGLVVIEDAAHATEARHRGRKIGAIGHMTAFSFYVTKNMTTGEGGMVTTADPSLAESIRRYGLHGLSHDAWARFADASRRHYTAAVAGFKYNMTDLQAALGIHQLAKIERGLERRNEIWRRYDEAFARLPVELPPPAEPETVHARHLYALGIDRAGAGIDRDAFMDRLRALGIGSGVHFVGVHRQPYYARRFGHRPEDFPNATWIGERTISLPLSAGLTDADVEAVIAGVSRVLGR
jgi:dTDP-4-amino-4,6-dideoxygalactose transaminase